MTSCHDESSVRSRNSPLAMRVAAAADQFELVDRGVADAVDLAKQRLRRVDHLRERAEFLQQRFRDRLHVAPRLRREQHHLQQFVIAQRVGAGARKSLAQPRPMAVIMRRLGGRAFRCVGLVVHRHKCAVPVSFCNREVAVIAQAWRKSVRWSRWGARGRSRKIELIFGRTHAMCGSQEEPLDFAIRR